MMMIPIERILKIEEGDAPSREENDRYVGGSQGHGISIKTTFSGVFIRMDAKNFDIKVEDGKSSITLTRFCRDPKEVKQIADALATIAANLQAELDK